MNKKQQRILDAIQLTPPPANLKWDDIESLFKALGATVSQGNGSRVRVLLNGVKATFHKPHPNNEVGRGCVRGIRTFLENANVI
ncbi:type II toxin-antitoxin system HicA family toxin [[Limnothrix rosea] IAM M-220]|uniref:type II toxin-antitoxin system HicA family toxin n=1 Tax=[Limnothrix rosea] IAM M-220 TaxID=454133 RepID=UPI0009601B4B|nr:type II toxin-antitoxin system HicA family toxin [[Limnothrix rosea] IAM M-220]OKH12339.1 hexulose-6-phosphate synthase [[Limnothrix rosea] IAM M-220]